MREFRLSLDELLRTLRGSTEDATEKACPLQKTIAEHEEGRPRAKDKVIICANADTNINASMAGVISASGSSGYSVDLDWGCTLLLPAWAPFSRTQPCRAAPFTAAAPAAAPAIPAANSIAAEASSELRGPAAATYEETEIASTRGNSKDIAIMADVEDADDEPPAKSPQTLIQGTVEYKQMWGSLYPLQ